MNVTLSKRGDYVVRSAISLARAYELGSPRKIREVVSETEVPQTFASQILADLVRAGLADSRAGRDGGYWLARPPEQITVLEVVEAGEGPLHAERCALGDGPCRWEAVCPLHETWSAATSALRDVLATTSLAELAARDQALESGTYEIPTDSHRLAPTSVIVTDAVHVELAEDVAGPRLADLARMLAPVLDAAWTEANEASTAPLGARGGHAASGGGTAPRVGEVSLVPAPPAASGAEGERSQLGWRVSTQESDFLLEADLRLAAVDAERSELRLEGNWKQIPRLASARLRGEELEAFAGRSVRFFLRRLARALESGSNAPSAPTRRTRSKTG